MYQVSLTQEGKEKILGLVENKEDLKALLTLLKEALPLEKQGDSFYLEPDQLPNYVEVDFKGHLLAISRFEFSSPDRIFLDIESHTNLSRPGKGYLEEAAIIENYSIPYPELKDYICKREAAYERVKKSLEGLGYQVGRSLQGSEDGEAIVLEEGPQDQWYFAALDPAFVDQVPEDEEALKSFVLSFLNDQEEA